MHPTPSAEDAFALFGLPRLYAVDGAALEQALMQAGLRWHPDRYALAEEAARLQAEDRMAAFNQAHAELSDPLTRAELLLRLAGLDPRGGQAAPGFLMDMMELREDCDDLARHAVSMAGNEEACAVEARLHAQQRVAELHDDEMQALDQFGRLWDDAQSAATTPDLEVMNPLLHKARYLRSTRNQLSLALRPGP